MKKNFLNLLLLCPSFVCLVSCDNTKSFSFNQIFEWGSQIKVDSLDTITVENGWIGVAPEYMVISQKSTQNPEYFLKFFTWINNVKFTETDYNLMGGKYVEVEFKLLDETSYKLRISNGTISQCNLKDCTFYSLSIGIPEILE